MKIMEFERRLYLHSEALKQSMTAPFADETEDFIMKKAAEKKKVINYKKTVAIIAVAACFLLGSTAFAVGFQTGIFSWSEKEYTALPAEQQLVEDVGYAPQIVQSFENGFSYTNGHAVNNERMDEETGSVDSFKSAMFNYEKDGESVSLWQEKAENAFAPTGRVIGIVDGVELYYSSYVNKIVPADYQMTDADIEAEEKGELVFTWGSDSVMIMEVKNLTWIEDGISYMLLQTGGTLNADDMRAMAKEILAR